MGLGQIYNGEIGKGIIFIVAYAVSIVLMFAVVGFFSTPILWIFGMIDAEQSAQTINRQLAQGIEIIPAISVKESTRSASSSTPRSVTLDSMTKKCPECAETIKFEALVCRFCHYRFDSEDVQRHVAAARADLERNQPEPGEAASDLKECPGCHEWVWAGVDICPACSYGLRTGTTISSSPNAPPSFSVVLTQVPPSRRPALKDLLREIPHRSVRCRD